ncbi:hypothetical protein Ae201684_003715 [Aphanomyces euteiches]|uniref:Uncharacterized protein n=1 Tax=Aphanomyces euteiches TaxID=100861 RepID=A0A6G0XLD7_9STRA|nr:hypothetical protein Ae201684_003715 [Aphanomyces euteiches]
MHLPFHHRAPFAPRGLVAQPRQTFPYHAHWELIVWPDLRVVQYVPGAIFVLLLHNCPCHAHPEPTAMMAMLPVQHALLDMLVVRTRSCLVLPASIA